MLTPASCATCSCRRPGTRRLPGWGASPVASGVSRAAGAQEVAQFGLAPAAMLAGCLALLAGAVMSLAAIEIASAAAFLAGTAVAGAGLGIGFILGAYRILTRLAEPGQRASRIAAIWIAFFLAFSVPVVIAGVAATRFGLHRTAVVYSAALTMLAAAATGSVLSRRRPPAPDPRGSAGQPASTGR